MAYQTICARYGSAPFYGMMGGAALILPYAAGTSLGFCAGVLTGILGGDFLAPNLLRQRQVGLRRGSRIVRRMQLASVVAGGLLGGAYDYSGAVTVALDRGAPERQTATLPVTILAVHRVSAVPARPVASARGGAVPQMAYIRNSSPR